MGKMQIYWLLSQVVRIVTTGLRCETVWLLTQYSGLVLFPDTDTVHTNIQYVIADASKFEMWEILTGHQTLASPTDKQRRDEKTGKILCFFVYRPTPCTATSRSQSQTGTHVPALGRGFTMLLWRQSGQVVETESRRRWVNMLYAHQVSSDDCWDDLLPSSGSLRHRYDSDWIRQCGGTPLNIIVGLIY
jgi:hypothetical protein